MNDLPIDGFRRAIQATHGARALYRWHERVDEGFGGTPVWTGEVLVFELLDHPRASVIYCWEVDGEVTVVLGIPPVDSAQAAVRASIVAPGR